MQKYKEYVRKMLDENKEIFDDFKKVHDLYVIDEIKWYEDFNTKGVRVQEIIREYEDRLCRQTEKGNFSVFSPKLAEKYQEEVRKLFPMIDHVGLKTNYVPKAMKNNAGLTGTGDFSIKKISLD
jgi:hypothetical protein